MYLKIRGYNIYDTKHPDGIAHGGTATIMKIQSNISS